MEKTVEQLQHELQQAHVEISRLKESLHNNRPENIPHILNSDIDLTELRYHEDTLREHELTLYKIQHIAHVGSWEWNVTSNTLAFSPELYKIYDISPDEFDGNMTSLYDRIVHPDDRDYLQRATQLSIQEGKPQEVEFRVVRKDGSIRYLWGDATKSYDENGSLIRMIGVVQDITERKQIEDTLRQSERHFRNIIDASPIPFALNDDQQNITYLNSAFINTFGYDQSDIPTLSSWWPKAYPDKEYRQWVIDTWQQRLDQSMHQNKAFEPLELNIKCKNGTKKTVLVGAALLTNSYKGNHLVSFYDVTERKLAEETIRDSETRYRMIVETAQEGIWTIDSNNITSFVNPVMADMLGYSVEDMLGRTLFDFMDDEGRQIAAENIERRKAGIAEQHDFKFLHKDGVAVWAELNTGPLYGTNGKYIGAMAMITDITERRRSEKALRETQKLLLRAESLAHIGSWEWEIATNKVKWSPEMYRIYQYDPADYPEIDFSLAMARNHPEDTPMIQEYVENILKSGLTSSTTSRIILPDGSIRYVWSESEVIKDTHGKVTHMVGSLQDITERVIADQALQEGNKRFNALFEQSSFGVAKVDSGTGRFIEINQRYCDIVGYTPDELLNMNFQTITAEADLDIDLDNLEKLRAGIVTHYQREKRYIHRNGSVVWVNLSVLPLWVRGNTPDYNLTIVEDISKRKQAEEKLQKQQEEQQLLINNISDAIVVIEEDGTIQTFNTSAETIFGYICSEIIGQNVKQLIPESFAENQDLHLSEYSTTEIANVSTIPREIVGLHKNGGTIPLRLTVANLPQSPDGKRRFIYACHDITQEKQQEELLRRTQKMDALGKLTGGIAHDYNNMLGVILGYSKLLQDALIDNPKLSKYINEIHHASERGTKLSRKLLAFSRNIKPEASIVDINSMLITEYDMLQKTLTPRIKLELKLCDKPWPIYVNGGELEDAILNLCINAMHAIESSGDLTISTRNLTINHRDAQQYKLDRGDYVVLSIVDTGSGIESSHVSYIFDPFFTTKGQGGVGLGLSMVYGFIKRSGGEITVTSTVGKGSTFTLYFPRHTKLDDIRPSTKSTHKENLSGYETILIVDDEPAMVDLSKEILTTKGYKILTANNAEEALRIFKANSIDVLISDVIMPGMDGYQLADTMSQLKPDLKILLVSGYTDDRHTKKSGAGIEHRLLHKPFTSEDILKTVREIIDGPVANKIKYQPVIMIMDDDESIRRLFTINLKKLGVETIEASDGEQAILVYRQALENNQPIDAAILDIAIPAGLGGIETAQQILSINPDAKLIVSSADSTSPIMTNFAQYGFSGSLEKTFDREKIQQLLDQILSI